MPNAQTQLVHVVGTLNTQDGTGQFLYVTPTKHVPVGSAEWQAAPQSPTGVELVIEASDGVALATVPVSLMRPSDGDDDVHAMIDQMIPVHPGMARLSLRYHGAEVTAFTAGAEVASSAPASGLSFGLGQPGGSNKRVMSLDDTFVAEPGITYTVQVRPDGETLWQTIAMGLPVPETVLDRNQFPDADRADIRITRTNGFMESVVIEETVELVDTDD